jgi:hypothetical protein
VRRRDAITAILAALPALLLALSGWIKADGEAKAKAKAYESYGEYVESQLYRDEALLRALRDCQTLLKSKPALWSAYMMGVEVHTSGPVEGMPKQDDRQAQVVLDEIARREGWAGGK